MVIANERLKIPTLVRGRWGGVALGLCVDMDPRDAMAGGKWRGARGGLCAGLRHGRPHTPRPTCEPTGAARQPVAPGGPTRSLWRCRRQRRRPRGTGPPRIPPSRLGGIPRCRRPATAIRRGAMLLAATGEGAQLPYVCYEGAGPPPSHTCITGSRPRTSS